MNQLVGCEISDEPPDLNVLSPNEFLEVLNKDLDIYFVFVEGLRRISKVSKCQ